LGNDPNFATTVTNSLAGKMDKSANGSDIENVSVFLQNLGLGEARYVIQRGANANGAWIRWSDGAIEVFGAGGSNDNGLA
ncbi:phage tail protein, partial [Citrobacter freundii]